MNLCPDCGGFEFITQADGVSCKNCGLVIDDKPIENNPYISESTKNNASLPGMNSAGSKPIDGKIIKNHWLQSTKEKNL